MRSQLARKKLPVRPVFNLGNTMAFPRELREAIPDQHAARVLNLDSISGFASHTLLTGRSVHLKLGVKETGKLSGKYIVLMALQVDAARQLAATLAQLADEAERKEPLETVVSRSKRKP